MLTPKDHQHLSEWYNRVAQREPQQAGEIYMTRARESLARLADKIDGRSGAMLDGIDAQSIAFLFNRLVHVYGVKQTEGYMQDGVEAFRRLESHLWPQGLSRPLVMERLLNDGSGSTLSGGSRSLPGLRQGYPQKHHPRPNG